MKKCLHLKRKRHKKRRVPPQAPQMTARDMLMMRPRMAGKATDFRATWPDRFGDAAMLDRLERDYFGPAQTNQLSPQAVDDFEYFLSRLGALGAPARAPDMFGTLMTLGADGVEVETIRASDVYVVGVDPTSGPDECTEGHGRFLPDGSFLIEYMGPPLAIDQWSRPASVTKDPTPPTDDVSPEPRWPRYGHSAAVLAALAARRRKL